MPSATGRGWSSRASARTSPWSSRAGCSPPRLSVPGARLYAATNPDSPQHWLKTGYVDRAAELNLRAWHFKLSDNPSLSPEYVADLAAEYVGLWRRRMIDGAWVVAEGAI
ncbi:putative phage terminase [Streptomyces bingchenggensis BCW-1]|uniref:Putative phage terminase n=1 Tax=Streptomyces bingchenggensis (strain BCW-1) TaxID=749414 RepID=D7BX07_STRBB|nr:MULTISPECIES: putative phage terminase [Streptomyces]ADI05552.1 putative phage terminase [Streptomyces bingchenggensis BCW-1]